MTRAQKPDRNSDRALAEIRGLLGEYKKRHRRSRVDCYRYNPVSIRIRVIDPDFRSIDRSEREDQIWKLLQTLPEDVQADITFVLLLAPEEVSSSAANLEYQEFEKPSRSRL
jgi:hypothetical protein